MITVKGLSKSFGACRVLQDISFSIKRGDAVSLIGPSGSGKSTLLRCLNWLERPEEGTIQFDDVSFDARTITPQEIVRLRRRSSMVFQNFNLFRNLNSRDNVALPMIQVQKVAKKQAYERAEELLEKVGLKDKITSYPCFLSGGQQQRVAIARSLACNPDIILFDEPTSALDPEKVKEILLLIKTLTLEHQTMLIVTHEMNFAKTVSHKILFLDNGRILEQGPPDVVFSTGVSPRLQEFLSLSGK